MKNKNNNPNNIKILNELAGSVKIPAEYKNLTIDQMVEKAKKEHFNKQ